MKYILSCLIVGGLLLACSKENGNGTTPDPDTNNQSSVSAGMHQFDSEQQATAFIRQNGTLWIMGRGFLSTSGGSDEVNKLVQYGTDTDWAGISIGRNAVFALKKDGTLWSWGGADYVGRTGNSLIPTKVNSDTDWIYVYSGETVTFAIKRDGSLWGCGNTTISTISIFGDGGSNTRSTMSRIGTQSDWQSISMFGLQVFAVKTNGTIWGWGFAQNQATRRMLYGSDDSQTKAVQIGNGTEWTKIFPVGAGVVVLKRDGTLWGWGQNGTETISIQQPLQLNTSTDWIDIAGTIYNFVGLKKDGTAYVWRGKELAHLPTTTPFSNGTEVYTAIEPVGQYAGVIAQRKGAETYCMIGVNLNFFADVVGGYRLFSREENKNLIYQSCATL